MSYHVLSLLYLHSTEHQPSESHFLQNIDSAGNRNISMGKLYILCNELLSLLHVQNLNKMSTYEVHYMFYNDRNCLIIFILCRGVGKQPKKDFYRMQALSGPAKDTQQPKENTGKNEERLSEGWHGCKIPSDPL